MENYIDKKIEKDLKIGKKVEEHLFDLLTMEGFECETANIYQDTHEHWDITTTINGTFSRIDVKGKTKFDENDNICLELKTVQGDDGWMKAEKLHTIAFERDDCFVFVKRIELLDFVTEKMNEEDAIVGETRIYDDKKDLTRPYQRYTRIKYSTKDKPRRDVMVYVPFNDFQHLIYKTVYK